MRFLVKVTLPHETVNAMMVSGQFEKTMQSILGDMKPEAAYFTENEGFRTGYFIVDMQNVSDMPRLAEPFFHAFEAFVEFHPVMLPEDLQKASGDIAAAVRKYGA